MSVVYSEDPLYLKKINYRVGDKVNKGDVVALGESSEYTDIESLKRELAEVQGSRFQVELHNRIADVLLPERV